MTGNGQYLSSFRDEHRGQGLTYPAESPALTHHLTNIGTRTKTDDLAKDPGEKHTGRPERELQKMRPTAGVHGRGIVETGKPARSENQIEPGKNEGHEDSPTGR